MFIDQDEVLQRVCRELAQHEILAIDTEFVRERTYFPRLCLIQIASPDQCVCIDPITLSDLSPLLEVIYDPGILKILHAGRQDLEIFYQVRGDLPQPLFDTQIAADFAGLGEQISYASLVEQLLGEKLPKGETRTNWAKRPLTQAQLRYAVDDVAYLLPAYQHLLNELGPRTGWVLEDSKALANPDLYSIEIDHAYQRVKGASKLSSKGKFRLRQLARWREQTAIRKNLPRRWVIEDQSLLALSASEEDTLQAFGTITEINSKTLKRYGNELVQLLQDTPTENLAELKDRHTMLSQPEKQKLKQMKKFVEDRSDELGISASTLASKKELLQLLRRQTPDRLCNGWRKSILADELAAIATD